MGTVTRGQGETQRSKGAAWGDRMIGCGAYDRSINPGLRFPFERTIAACHPWPSPVTGNEFVPADAMSSHPIVGRLISGLVGKGAKRGEAYTLFVKG